MPNLQQPLFDTPQYLRLQKLVQKLKSLKHSTITKSYRLSLALCVFHVFQTTFHGFFVVFLLKKIHLNRSHWQTFHSFFVAKGYCFLPNCPLLIHRKRHKKVVHLLPKLSQFQLFPTHKIYPQRLQNQHHTPNRNHPQEPSFHAE